MTLAAKRKISLLRPHAVNLMSQGKIAVIREDLQYFWQILISVHGGPKSKFALIRAQSPMPWHCPFNSEDGQTPWICKVLKRIHFFNQISKDLLRFGSGVHFMWPIHFSLKQKWAGNFDSNIKNKQIWEVERKKSNERPEEVNKDSMCLAFSLLSLGHCTDRSGFTVIQTHIISPCFSERTQSNIPRRVLRCFKKCVVRSICDFLFSLSFLFWANILSEVWW